MRGGGAVGSDKKTINTKKSSKATTAPTKTKRIAAWLSRHKLPLGLAALTTIFLYAERDVWQPWMDKERIQHATLELLGKLEQGEDDDDARHPLQPYVLYATGMAVWEALGLSTIPVETAAGMVFHWHALAASAVGKLTGALLAFVVGRTVLHDVVQQRLMMQADAKKSNDDSSSTPLLALLRYNTQSPLVTALLMKFSVFPEFVKNVGTAVLFPSVSPGHFLLATLLHGGLFTAVWTAVGVEAAAELHGTHVEHVPLWVFQYAVPVVLAAGMGLPVVLMAWWAQKLRQEQQYQEQQATAIGKRMLPKRRFGR